MTRAVASRVDRTAGYREEAGFLDIDGTRMFAVTYVPVSDARMGVVICSSILIEHMTNYRREVVLARALAARGMAVQRFHYRGTGHSAGDESQVTQDLLVEDTRAVVKHFAEQSGVSRLAFVGSRWGALVAAMAATDSPQIPLVLVEPVVDTNRYFRDLGRARRVIDLRATADEWETGESQQVLEKGSRPAATSLEQEFEKQGWADTLGWMLYEPLYTSGSGKRLDEVLMDRTGPLLLVQLDRGKTLKPEFADLMSQVQSSQFDVRLITDEPGWFFPGSEMRAIDPLVEITVQWLSDH